MPVTPSEPEGSKGKEKRHSKGLITAKKWTPIATQRIRKPQTSASIQGEPTLITCTGKITIVNPVVTSEAKLPKSVDKKFEQVTVKVKYPKNIYCELFSNTYMSPVHHRDLRIPRNKPEEREGLSRTRRPGSRHLGHSGRWEDIEVNNTHSAIHFPIQQKPQTRGLQGYG
ncbi:hypothetical protein O181_034007 [Austropuccinia psidii MF-1]|uniref:Uncharacterized protein n=1 Tax=Austropuccinia psidii MF-1 TaxID=1389203 RepID=A0A9Q3H7P1_9BASI|nr:hypothetical protein [Austropuccinia psidii MF-1]